MAEHECSFPVQPPDGTFFNPGPCKTCSKPYVLSQAEQAIDNALEALAAAGSRTGDVHAYPVAWQVSLWPEGEDTENSETWSITVAYRGHGKWAVLQGGAGSRLCLGDDGEWDWEPSPSNREDGWLEAHRFGLSRALALAAEWAPKYRINNLTAAEVRAREAARRGADA